MVWQKLTGHINDNRVHVESKSGNTYPAETKYDWLNDGIYSQLINEAHDDKQFWAWVEFEDDGPVVKDTTRGDMPTEPPWEHP